MKKAFDARFLPILLALTLAACSRGTPISAPGEAGPEPASAQAVQDDNGGIAQAAQTDDDVAPNDAPSDREESAGDVADTEDADTGVPEAVADADSVADGPVEAADSNADDDWLASLEAEYDTDPEADVTIADPLYYYNHIWHHFNDKTYFWVLKPLSKGYDAIVNRPVKTHVHKFFDNIAWPRRFANLMFQGRFTEATSETTRFALNTTVGLLGFFDPAREMGLNAINADFDQTLAKRGFNDGVYIVWPLFGPSSVRGTFGIVMDTVLNPTTFLPGVSTIDKMNRMSLGIDPYEEIVNASVHPYVAVRNAYVQYRDQMAKK